LTACKFESLTASPGRRDGFRLTPLRTCSCGRGRPRARLSCSPWSVPSMRPASSRQRRQACAQRRGDRDSGRARRGFSRPPSGLKWPRGVSSFMTCHQRAPVTISPEAGMTCHPSVVQIVTVTTLGDKRYSQSRGPPRRSRECRAPDSNGPCAGSCARRCWTILAKLTRVARRW
jgi:hypothetical protein